MSKKMPKVLVLSNEGKEAGTIKSALIKNNYDSQTVKEAFNAVYTIEHEYYDMAIVSTKFDDMALAELLMCLPENSKNKNLPILLILDSKEYEEVINDGLRERFDEYIEIPFVISQLLQKVEILLMASEEI